MIEWADQSCRSKPSLLCIWIAWGKVSLLYTNGCGASPKQYCVCLIESSKKKKKKTKLAGHGEERRSANAHWETMRRMVVRVAEDNFQRNKKSRLDQTKMLHWAELHRGSNIKPDWLHTQPSKAAAHWKQHCCPFHCFSRPLFSVLLLISITFFKKNYCCSLLRFIRTRNCLSLFAALFMETFCHTFYILKHLCKSPFLLLKRSKKTFKQRKI